MIVAKTKKLFKQVYESAVRAFVIPNKEKEENMKQPIYAWGKTNNFPDELDKQIKESDSLESGFQSLTELAFGLGIFVYKNVVKDGEVVIVPIVDSPANKFIEDNNVHEEYLEKAFYNFFRYANTWPLFRQDMKGVINGLFVYDSPWCRMEKLNHNSRRVENIYVSDQWNTREMKNLTEFDKYKKFVTKTKLIDRLNWQNFMKKNKNEQWLAWHIADYTPGTKYYGEAPWFPLLTNGIIETDKLTGKKLKAYYDKAMSILYHVEVSDTYVAAKCGTDLSPQNQEKVMRDIQETIDTHLIGAENSYGSIVTTMVRDQRLGELVSNVRIKVLDNPMNNSSVIKDTQLVSSRINNALRMDDAIINSKTSGSKEADSGSEKKNALNTHNTRMELIRQKVLYPLYIIKHVNGWDADLKFGIKITELQSLDKNPTGQTQKVN